MSQEKVQKYKEAKASRKETMKKEKRVKIIINIAVIVIPVVLLLLLVDSGVRTYLASRPRESVSVDYTDLSDYVEELTADEEKEKEEDKKTEDEKTDKKADEKEDSKDAK